MKIHSILTFFATVVMASSQLFAAGMLTVNASQTFQAIDGFGANVNTGFWNNGEVTPALDLLTDQLGATLIRACIEEMDWEATNDNSNPNIFNWTYYNAIYSNARFQGIWNTLKYLNQKGITDGLIISFMGKGPDWMGANEVIDTDKEDEFVETMASLYFYARNTKGINFTLISPLNETDTGGVEGPNMTPTQHARVLHKLAVKLDAIGMSDLRFVASEAASDYNGYFNAIVADPVVMAKLAHWGVHQYGGDASAYQGPITASAFPNKTFWVTESADFNNMFGMLDDNATANMVWDGFDSIYQHAIRAGRGSTPPNDSPGIQEPLIAYNSTTHIFTPRKQFYQHAQLMKFVAPGARRIAATVSNNSALTAYAYQHPTTGRLTIVGRNTSASNNTFTVNLTNLPAAVTTLQRYQTNGELNLTRAADVTVSNGTFSITVPTDTYFTLVTPLAFAPVSVSLTAPVIGTRVAAPASMTLTATAASTAGSITKVEFFNGSTKLGKDTTSPYSYAWKNVAAGTYAITAKATDSLGNTRTTAATSVTVVGPLAQITVSPATITLTPSATQAFTAKGFDALGEPVITPPTFTWACNRGGTISKAGLFKAGTTVGGPFSISASSGAIKGTAAVTIVQIKGGTIGNTAEGTFTDNIWDGGAYINACRFQASADMTVNLMRAKVTIITGHYQCAIYSDNAGNPSALLRASAEITNPSDGWHDFAFSSPLTLAGGTNYWLAIWSDSANARVYATNGGTIRWSQRAYNLGWPASLTTSGGASTTYSIYATGPTLAAFQLPKSSSKIAVATPSDSDADPDGPISLLENALGINPSVASRQPSATRDVNGNLTLTFLRARADLTYIVQGSNDLQTWTDLATNPGTVGQNFTFTDTVATDSRFMRLKITQP